jgi:anti-sigma B factor antagonist
MSTVGSQQVDGGFAITCRRLEDACGLGSLVDAGQAQGLVLALSGEVDLASAPIVEDELRRTEASEGLIIIDLRDVTFMDSTGVRMLVTADRRAHERGATLVVVQGSPQVRRLFELSGLTGHLDVVEGDDREPIAGD